MSVLDDEVVRAIGAVTSGFRIEIPLYMRVSPVLPPPVPPSRCYHPPPPCQRDISIQSLAAIILEIPDMSQLRRYFDVYEAKLKERNDNYHSFLD